MTTPCLHGKFITSFLSVHFLKNEGEKTLPETETSTDDVQADFSKLSKMDLSEAMPVVSKLSRHLEDPVWLNSRLGYLGPTSRNNTPDPLDSGDRTIISQIGLKVAFEERYISASQIAQLFHSTNGLEALDAVMAGVTV